jgi:hypothetical protein
MFALVRNSRYYQNFRKQLKRLDEDESGRGVDDVMWIAVGVLILVGVVALVAIFWTEIQEGVGKILGDDKKPKKIL